MAKEIVIYRNPDEKRTHSWIKWIIARIFRKNQNVMLSVVGKTGSGKTFIGLSMGELISKKTGVPFTIDNVVFSLRELMTLINSKKLKKGSTIVFDEPQISIGNREFQSEANKVFNFLVSTFRHKNLILLFCTPYSDLLDKTTRKLFHAQFLTKSIDRNKNACRVKPTLQEWIANEQKFYYPFLRVRYKPKSKLRYVTKKLKYWDIPKPSNELIVLYEKKKKDFTSDLNEKIEKRLEHFDMKQEEKYKFNEPIVSEFAGKKKLSDLQLQIHGCWKEGTFIQVEIAKELKKPKPLISASIQSMRKKGYFEEEYREIAKTQKNTIKIPAPAP